MNRGYYAIGMENIKTESNIGTLWRSAKIFEAQYIFTINRRYKYQSSDTYKTYRHIPLMHYKTTDDFIIPHDCKLVGVEICDTAIPIKYYKHPERAIYILGAEDHGLTNKMMDMCHEIIQLPGEFCLNVATAGSIVMYDRYIKRCKDE
jgi:tRNA G18 (ribose-2'-O)-methylase SpoU